MAKSLHSIITREYLNSQTFTSDGTFYLPAGYQGPIFITGCGGGCAGRYSSSTTYGGGAGQIALRVPFVVDETYFSSGIPVTVGAGGLPGASYYWPSSSTSSGGTGSASTIGAANSGVYLNLNGGGTQLGGGNNDTATTGHGATITPAHGDVIAYSTDIFWRTFTGLLLPGAESGAGGTTTVYRGGQYEQLPAWAAEFGMTGRSWYYEQSWILDSNLRGSIPGYGFGESGVMNKTLYGTAEGYTAYNSIPAPGYGFGGHSGYWGNSTASDHKNYQAQRGGPGIVIIEWLP